MTTVESPSASVQPNLQTRVRNPVVVALDVETAGQALALVEKLRGRVGMFKIGKQLFTAAGPDIVRRVIALGEEVFLDLKFHDIPNTVAGAAVEATRLGVKILNLHAAGGSAMMRASIAAVDNVVSREGLARPLILGVTVLTSMDQAALVEIGITGSVEDQVIRLARLCAAAGMDGVVASPLELTAIRRAIDNPRFITLVPGVRPAGAALNDQSRVMTPAEALAAGADYLVIGRPITAAPDPAAAAENILKEIGSF
ncbi:MAG: orotidine-5'-phosphate decarboxylase [Blastocatellia bacterium]